MSGVVVLIAILAIRGLAHYSQKKNGAPVAQTARGGGPLVWWLLLVAWLIFSIYALATALSLLVDGAVVTAATLLDIAWKVLVVAAGACFFFFAWTILSALARGGRPKLVYYLARIALVFPSTGETRSGACLLALLALARRGDVTAAEREWVRARLRNEKRHLGTYATACALHLLLESRAARDEGRIGDAHQSLHRARILLGTVTYVSARGVPSAVRKIVWELLGLDDARLGHWGSLEIAPEKALTPVSRVLRGWTRERLMDKPAEPKVDRLRRKLTSPGLDRLFARTNESLRPDGARAMWMRAQRHFRVLVLGGSIGPRHVMNVLATFDVMLHPEFPETMLPEAIRTDDELVAGVHEEIAAALTEPILREGAPLFAMKAYGPISARVYQRVEAALFGEMERTLRALDMRTKAGHRRDSAFEEWLEASEVRSLYRRIEMALGPDAIGQVWPHFVFSYCNLGVQLAETAPRMRPLAHAIFKCLSGEAVRFDDKENIKQQAHNMRVTAGAE